MAAAEAAYEALRYAISHDLAAPVRHVLAFSEILIERVGDRLEDREQEILDHLGNAAGRLDTMLSAMQTHAALVKRPVELVDEVDVDALVDKAVSRRLVGAGLPDGRDLPQGTTVTIAGAIGAPVRTDPELVMIIVTELVANATAFGRPDEPNAVTVGARCTGGALVLEVADQGTGMRDDFLDRATKLFGRLVTESQHPGVGLGLTLVRDALDHLGGTLVREQVEPFGSRFIVTLPDACA